MKWAILTILTLVLALAASCTGHDEPESTLQYPETLRVEQTDSYHGVEVSDPYRWLEDLDSPETRAWVEAQNKVTFGFLNTIPERAGLKARLTQLWNYEKVDVPEKVGERYFFAKNDGLQNQDVIYVQEGLRGQPRLLLDPNALSEDGTVALREKVFSPDGSLMAYGTSSGGSDWQEWRIREVATARDLSDTIQWVKFSSASWSKDGKGFYYSRYDEPSSDEAMEGLNYHQKVYYHRVGDPQSEDRLVYERPDQKEWGFRADVSDDGRYLVLQIREGTDTRNRIYYKDLTSGKVVELLDGFDASYEFLGNDGPWFWFHTDLEAPRGRVIAIDARDSSRVKELIPQTEDTLREVAVVGGSFVATYLRDARNEVVLYDLKGRGKGRIELAGLGSVEGFTGDRSETETFYSFESFSVPETIYRYDFATGENSVFAAPPVQFDPDDFETRQVFFESKDGTRVPMFLSFKKGLQLDGRNPTILYGYGGFNIPVRPQFAVLNLAWMELGGVYASANLRGGGEYGESWHKAGTRLQKQNVFDDFIAAAEWLIENQYTSTPRLAIRGASNGGLLVGAAMLQRPDLFGAALPAVGVMDMLRFNKFTIGWAWESDYGSPEDLEEFQALYAYSPYHNLKPGTRYPATLITTADHDDRVVPSHSFKFAAALQRAQAGPAPVLIRIETRAGHGAGKPTAKRIEEAADMLGFLVKVMDLHVKPME